MAGLSGNRVGTFGRGLLQNKSKTKYLLKSTVTITHTLDMYKFGHKQGNDSIAFGQCYVT